MCSFGSNLSPSRYNGCIARILKQNPAQDRAPVFVYMFWKGILVQPKHLEEANLQDAFEAVCHSLANDELPLMFKDLVSQRFLQAGGKWRKHHHEISALAAILRLSRSRGIS